MSYLAYTGIGSRETPTHICNIMFDLARYMYSEGWTLRSGAAEGADSAFERGVNAMMANTMTNGQDLPAFKEIYLPWKGFNHSSSEVHPANIPFSQEEINFTAMNHPAWNKCSPSARLLHQRNTRQILGCQALHGEEVSPTKLIICWTKNGKLQGGTAQALRIANGIGIPIINLGEATTTQELEALVLRVEAIQKEIKKDMNHG